MRVLITGSNGYIGCHLVRYLKSKNYQVIGLSGDVTDMESIRPDFKYVDVVVHLAAKLNDSRQGEYFEINVGGTMNVIRLCLEYDCKLIYLSSTASKTDYGITKRLAENLVELYAEEGLKAVTIRPSSIRPIGQKAASGSNSYPMERLLADIERIIINNDFRYKVYRTRTFKQKVRSTGRMILRLLGYKA